MATSQYRAYSVGYKKNGIDKVAMAWGGKPSAERAYKIMCARARTNSAITDIELLGMDAEGKPKLIEGSF
jgi:hypothetical protein